MTDLRKAAEMALEALYRGESELRFAAHEALREALAQPEQEHWDAIPDAFNQWWNSDLDDTGNPYRKDCPAYWALEGWKAASRLEWVGLTNQELFDLVAIYSGAPLYSAIEAKLKEKNHE